MRKLFALATVAALSLLGVLTTACAPGPQASPASPPALRVDNVAPAFTLPAANGKTVSLAEYLGKTPVLLYFNMGSI